MFRNYFITAVRNFYKNKIITVITILGMAIGISAALIIYEIVQYDYSFDKFEPDRNRIYRIVSQGVTMRNPGVPAPLHEALHNESTGIVTVAAFFEYLNANVGILQNNNQPVKVFKKQEDIVFTDSNYFNIFPHQWITGNAVISLNAPYRLVLSESRAKLYFPGLSMNQIIGKTVVFNDSIQTVVSGIVKDLNVASDFNNKEFISLSTIPNSGLKGDFYWDQWDIPNVVSQLFVKLSPGTSPKNVEKQIASIFKTHRDKNEYSSKITHPLQALSDIHFNKEFDGPGNKSALQNLILLAIILLLLGSINFVNLSTAQASQRAKEIGIRKTLGSTRRQLVSQFLTETFLLTLLATILSLLILPFLFDAFTGYIPGGLKYEAILQPATLLFLLMLVIIVSLFSGFYPALILTKFKPAMIIRNQAPSGAGQNHSTWIRRVLIIAQFVIAQVFIVSVLIVNKQIRFSLEKDMGFRKEAIINFNLPVPNDLSHIDHKKFILRDKLRTIPEIQAVSLSATPPVFNDRIATIVKYKKGQNIINVHADVRMGDTAFLNLYHIKLLAGRNILAKDSTTELLINAMLANDMGFQRPQDALGKFLEIGNRLLPIVGVISDFNDASLRSPVHPMIYYSKPANYYEMNVALLPNPNTWPTTIEKIQNTWKSVYPDQDFNYTFLDKTIAHFYKEDVKLSKLLEWAAGIAILIGCLGLLGLVIFMANQRTKEIGIRKVLGASLLQIITLLSKDLIRLVALAFIIALPIAWWIMRKWLENFAYHTRLSWWIFVISGALMLIVALIILSIRAGRAAMANPVEALRSE